MTRLALDGGPEYFVGMIFSGLFIFFLLFLSPHSVLAETRLENVLGLKVKALGFGPTADTPTDSQWSQYFSELHLQPTLKSKVSANHYFKTSPSIRFDSFTREKSEQTRLTWNDTYYEYRQGNAKLRGGFQNVVWEGTDFSNPLDLLMQKSFVDPLEPSLISSPGIGLLYEFSSMQMDFYYFPEMAASQLPGAKNPWWPRRLGLHFETPDFVVRIPEGIEYQIAPIEEIGKPRANSWGGRLQYKTDILDSSFVFFDGLANVPHVLTNLTFNSVSVDGRTWLATSPVGIRQILYRSQAAGFMITLPLQKNIFRLGGNSIRPYKDDPRVPGSSASQVLAWERSFDLKKGPLTILFQLHQNQNPKSGSLSSFHSLFTRAAAAGLRWSINEDTSLTGGIVYSLIEFSMLNKLEITRRLGAKYEIGIFAVDLRGAPDTLLGVYDPYDSFGVKLNGYF